MVLGAVKWSLRLASCWSVEVMKGAAGFRRRSPRVTLFTFHTAPCRPVMTFRVSASDGRLAFSPLTSRSVAVNSGGFFPLSRACRDQYSVGTKAWISRSRSVMSRTATDCTRPADRPRRLLGEERPRHRRPAARRQAPADLLPEKRRELVADEAIEHSPRLLRVHLLAVDLAGMLEGRLDRALRDLVEHDPVRLGLRHPQLLGQVPSNRLAFTIRVRCDEQGIRPLGHLLQVVQYLLLGGQDMVDGLEALLLVHAQLALGQIADVPHGRLNDVLRVQILLDRLDLGRRLDNDQ